MPSERTRTDMHQLISRATPADLRRGTNGTRWTNGQMLWHMAFGYVLVRRLLPLVRAFSRLPESFSRTFAAALQAHVRSITSTTWVLSAVRSSSTDRG